MKYFYAEQNKLRPCNDGQEPSHILLTIDEYNALTISIEQLKRITKERSNAERGLKPKKQRSGYLLLGYDNSMLRMDFEKGSLGFNAMRLLIETPYTVKLNYADAQKLILEDLIALAPSLGAAGVINKTDLDNAEIFKSLFTFESEKMIIFSGLECQRTGAWAVRFYANYAPNIPEDFIKTNDKQEEK